MKDREIINKRVRLEKLKGQIIDQIWEDASDEDDGISYDDCVQILLQVVDLLQVHKGH